MIPIAIIAVVAIGVVVVAAAAIHDDPEHVRPPLPARPDAGVAIGTPDLAMSGWAQEGIVAAHAAYQEAVDAELETQRLEAERLAAIRAVASQPVARPRTQSTVGECTGFAVPDYIIQRESGGNPSALNAGSGAYGCAQVMPMHWNGGACSDLDKYTIEGQRECVDRLSNGGTNLAPWR